MTTDPGERLHAAAKDAIRAARSMLDAVEDIVDDRDRVRDAAAGAGNFLADFIEALVDLAGSPTTGRGQSSRNGGDDGPGTRLRRLNIDGAGSAAGGDDDEEGDGQGDGGRHSAADGPSG